MKNHFALALASANRELTIRNQLVAAQIRPDLVADARLYFGRMDADAVAGHIGANADAGVVDRLRADGIEVDAVGDVTAVEEQDGERWQSDDVNLNY